MLEYVSELHFFVLPHNIHYKETQLIHLTVDGLVGFHFGAIVNNAVKNICVHVSM